MSIEKRVDGALITLKCASPHEIAGLVNLDKEIERELEGLKRKLCSYQISRFAMRNRGLKRGLKFCGIKDYMIITVALTDLRPS
jgi:hypothetical protein